MCVPGTSPHPANHAPMTNTTSTAAQQKIDRALAEHNTAIEQLAEAVLYNRAGCHGSTWADVGTAGHVRAILAQAALALGAITEEQAADHNA